MFKLGSSSFTSFPVCLSLFFLFFFFIPKISTKMGNLQPLHLTWVRFNFSFRKRNKYSLTLTLLGEFFNEFEVACFEKRNVHLYSLNSLLFVGKKITCSGEKRERKRQRESRGKEKKEIANQKTNRTMRRTRTWVTHRKNSRELEFKSRIKGSKCMCLHASLPVAQITSLRETKNTTQI